MCRTRLAGMRNRLEGPAQAAGAHVKGADVSRRRRAGALGEPRADDQQVLVDRPRSVREHIQVLRAIAEAFFEADAALLTECRDGLSGGRVQRVEALAERYQDAPVVSRFPVHDAAIDAERVRLRAAVARERVERPPRGAGGGVEREDLQLRRRRVEHATHDDRVALDLRPSLRTRVAGAIGPRHLEARDVLGGDLIERRELRVSGVSAVGRPVVVGRPAAATGQREKDGPSGDVAKAHGREV